MQEKNKSFKEIVQDIRNLLKVKGFEFKPFRHRKVSAGMKMEEFRVENEVLAIIISIQENERLPLG